MVSVAFVEGTMSTVLMATGQNYDCEDGMESSCACENEHPGPGGMSYANDHSVETCDGRNQAKRARRDESFANE